MKQFARCALARSALALALVVASSSASALGLGEIVVRSRLDQPLLAEIPIISNDPAELERLQARLASPETFARVGLEPPQGVVSNLRFMVGLDNAGNPVVRVTSAQPVDQAALTFLIEVDWGQGRLVREYSALLDAPRTVSAAAQPPIEAPTVAPSNQIVREPAVSDEAAADAVAAGDAGTTVPTAPPTEPTPEPPPVATAPAQPRPAAVARPVRRIDGDSYQVSSGDTLSHIASRIDGARGLSLNQRMVALLQANPEAFIGGNIHQVKSGAVLRIPDAEAMAGFERAEADELVREQTRQWRQPVATVPQPADAGRVGVPAPASGQAQQAAVADARLEIVPPGASDANQAGNTPGNQSGISAGGEGNMLRQDMQQAQETLAAREAELGEMKARIAELEKLQQQQQKLLELKDSELAEVQQRLATQSATAAPQDAGQGTAMPWLFGGFGLLLAALAGGWALRQRNAKPVFRAPDESHGERRSSVADAFAAGAAGAAVAAPTAADDEATATGSEAAAVVPAPAAATAGPEPAADAGAGAPAWHGAQEQEAEDEPSPVMADATAGNGGGNERLELARAYIALGDRDSARQLLAEVRLHGDLAARQQAMQMLRELE
ncbi:FimV/HubP family polar landmark protein [Marilutibacter maris]|nr:FimV/HubP family polar landmark protein [Lysobacter maris]